MRSLWLEHGHLRRQSSSLATIHRWVTGTPSSISVWSWTDSIASPLASTRLRLVTASHPLQYIGTPRKRSSSDGRTPAPAAIVTIRNPPGFSHDRIA